MEYKRKNITINVELFEKLKKEGNASDTITRALTMYYDAKELTKQLTQLVQDFEANAGALFTDIEQLKSDVKFIKQKAGAEY